MTLVTCIYTSHILRENLVDWWFHICAAIPTPEGFLIVHQPFWIINLVIFGFSLNEGFGWRLLVLYLFFET